MQRAKLQHQNGKIRRFRVNALDHSQNISAKPCYLYRGTHPKSFIGLSSELIVGRMQTNKAPTLFVKTSVDEVQT